MHLISQTEDVVVLSALSLVQCMTLCNARSERLAFCVKQVMQQALQACCAMQNVPFYSIYAPP